jgi:UDP-N-acetylglucosamine transferase subunit ALG13
VIFVTVGTDTHQFNRLLEEIDRQIELKKIKEKVVGQIGNSTYFPKHFASSRFFDSKKMMQLIRNSDVVVSHAGIGSIMTIKENLKPLVVVPRLKKFDEHTDNHQVQIAKELDRQGKVVAVLNISDLSSAITKARRGRKAGLRATRISKLVSNYLSKLVSP